MINKEAEYQKVIDELQHFFHKYDQPKLSLLAKYTSVASALKRHVSALFFVGFYVVVGPEYRYSLGDALEVGPY